MSAEQDWYEKLIKQIRRAEHVDDLFEEAGVDGGKSVTDRALAAQLPTPNSQLPTPNSQLPTPNSQLPTNILLCYSVPSLW